jgi:hypothetical protein
MSDHAISDHDDDRFARATHMNIFKKMKGCPGRQLFMAGNHQQFDLSYYIYLHVIL